MANQFDWSGTAQTGAFIGFAALLGTMVRWRDWRNPPDMKLPDGTLHPNAGQISRVKMFGDLAFVPALTIMVFAAGRAIAFWKGWQIDPAILAGLAAGLAMLGSSFFLRTFENIRDSAIQAAAKRLGGGS